ncbi:MAG: GNAT family N-acetyltransferase [Candidatus Omnitrophica bacterium]|nr:GNAT family N-acetyltransferase [Candidatus Omnitrophota bacterium]
MTRKVTFKIIAFLISFVLFFQQTGFAQVAGELDLSAHFASLQGNFIPQDKFRPLHLRYLEFNPAQENFRLLLDKGDWSRGAPKPTGWVGAPLSAGTVLVLASNSASRELSLKEETQKLLQYFYIGLALPNDSFWVNLRPDSPQDIIDPYLEQTDIGKILLETDVQLKKDTALLTSPQTPSGKLYWKKLYEKAGELFGNENITIPTLTRPWIVPGEIIVRDAPANAYIYKATLKVMLEEDYLGDGSEAVLRTVPNPRIRALNTYASELLRELVIPKLTQIVNTSKRYAPLRQVYYSLILAQWYKSRFKGQSPSSKATNNLTGTVPVLIDSRNLADLTSSIPWSKASYYQEYQKSFKDGEYNIQESVYTPAGQVIRSYTSGGINLGGTVSSAIVAQKIEANSSLRSIPSFGIAGEVKGGNLQSLDVRDDQGVLSETEGSSPFTEGTLPERLQNRPRTTSEPSLDSASSPLSRSHKVGNIELRISGGRAPSYRSPTIVDRFLTEEERQRLTERVSNIFAHLLKNNLTRLQQYIENLGFDLDVENKRVVFDISYYASGYKKDVFRLTIRVEGGGVKEFLIIVKSDLRNDDPLFEEGELEMEKDLQGTGYVPRLGGVFYIEMSQNGLAAMQESYGAVLTGKPVPEQEHKYTTILIEEFIEGPTIAQDIEQRIAWDVEREQACILLLMNIFFELNKGRNTFVGPFDFHHHNIVIETAKNRMVIVDLGRRVTYSSLGEYLLGVLFYYGGKSGKALEVLYREWPQFDWDTQLLSIRRKVLEAKRVHLIHKDQVVLGKYSFTRQDCNRIAKAITTFLYHARDYRFREGRLSKMPRIADTLSAHQSDATGGTQDASSPLTEGTLLSTASEPSLGLGGVSSPIDDSIDSRDAEVPVMAREFIHARPDNVEVRTTGVITPYNPRPRKAGLDVCIAVVAHNPSQHKGVLAHFLPVLPKEKQILGLDERDYISRLESHLEELFADINAIEKGGEQEWRVAIVEAKGFFNRQITVALIKGFLMHRKGIAEHNIIFREGQYNKYVSLDYYGDVAINKIEEEGTEVFVETISLGGLETAASSLAQGEKGAEGEPSFESIQLKPGYSEELQREVFDIIDTIDGIEIPVGILEYKDDFRKRRIVFWNIVINPDYLRRGYATAVVRKLAQEARRKYPEEEYSFYIETVINPWLLEVAQRVLDMKTLQSSFSPLGPWDDFDIEEFRDAEKIGTGFPSHPGQRELVKHVYLRGRAQASSPIEDYADQTSRIRGYLPGVNNQQHMRAFLQAHEEGIALRQNDQESVSSPFAEDISEDLEGKGGIDFRALPIVEQVRTDHFASPGHTGDIQELQSQWNEIERMLHAGIIPSGVRLKEYLVASGSREERKLPAEKLFACVAQIMRLEEERVISTDPLLKEVLSSIE